MSVLAARVTVGTAATDLTSTDADFQPGSSIAIKVPSGGATVFLGSQAVTTATGFELVAGEVYALDLRAGETIHAIVASGTQVVHVLRTGV